MLVLSRQLEESIVIGDEIVVKVVDIRGDKVRLGIVAPERLSWAYSEATVRLCLSLSNLSLIPQEMMACGLPCVDLAGGSTEAELGDQGGVQLASAVSTRSLMRHSGSRTLHLVYCSQAWSSVEQAVTVRGPSTAWITSATDIIVAGRASRYPPRVP